VNSCGHIEALAIQSMPWHILMQLGILRHGIPIQCFPGWYISHPHELISSGDGRCSSESEFSLSNGTGILMADVTATSLWCYCPYHKNHFLLTKMWVPNWELFGTGQKFYPSSTLSKLTREHRGEKPWIPRSEDHARTLPPSS
jgi:hypothetical protein